jgi:CheY-like chemotaxis protein
MEATAARSVNIVIVEDSKIDTKLIEMGIEESSIKGNYVAFDNADHAMRYLREHSKSDARPDLVILDLYLAGTNGWEFLRSCQSDPSLNSIPISVFTSAPEELESKGCFALGASHVLSKPFETETFIWAVQSLVSSLKH